MSSNRKRHINDTSPSTSDFEDDLEDGKQSSRAVPVDQSNKRSKKVDDAENDEDGTKKDEKLSEERIIQTMDAKTCLSLLSSMTATGVVPYHPKGGHIYVYEWSSDQDLDDDWKRDGYNWRDYGKKPAFDGAFTVHTLVARIGPKVGGRYPKSSISNSFQKKAYSHPSFPRKVLVNYIGDESVDVQRAHGNSRKPAKMDVPFNSTHRKVMRKIASMHGKPATVCRNAFLEGSEDVRSIPTTQVRDNQQVSNIQRSEKNRTRLSPCTVYNLHMFQTSPELKYFVHRMDSSADEIKIFGYDNDLVEVLTKIIDRSDLGEIQLTYDTKFKVAKHLLSVLSFTWAECEDPQPTIPFAYILHERKKNDTHAFFWRNLVQIVPRLLTAKNVFIVTDQEKAITNAIENHLPNISLFRCRNHVVNDAKFRLRDINVKGEQLKNIISDIHDLFNQDSHADYINTLLQKNALWNNPEFYNYFYANIHPDADRIGRWAVQRRTGKATLTTNRAEALNGVIERLDIQGLSIDMAILTLYRHFKSYFYDMERVRYGVGAGIEGKSKLRPHLRNEYRLMKDTPLLNRKIPTGQEIIEQLKNDARELNNLKRSDDGSTGKEDEIDEDLASFSMGNELVRENKIEWFPQTQSFLVHAEGGPFGVKMFPRPSCSCKVEQGTCSHVCAIKVGLGISTKKTKVPSIAKMRQLQRSKGDKTAGNKNPRANDVDVEQQNQGTCDADFRELPESARTAKPHSLKKNKRVTFKGKGASPRNVFSSKTDRANDGMDPTGNTPEYQASDYEIKSNQKYAPKDFFQPSSRIDEQPVDAPTKDTSPKVDSSGIKDKPSTSQDSCIGKEKGSKVKEIEFPFSLGENVYIDDTGHMNIIMDGDIDDECSVISEQKQSADISQYEILEIIQQNRGSERPSDPREDRFIDEIDIYKIGDEKYELTDLEMNAALTLLRKLDHDLGLECKGLMNVDWAYPAYPGAYDADQNGSKLSTKPSPKEKRKMIQLLHNGDAKSGHWLVVCQGFFDSPIVRGAKKTKDSSLPRVSIFDSLGPHYSKKPHVLASCASLLRSETPFFVDIRDCQYQGDTSSCGVFSIAFATSILYGKNPTNLVFDKPQMRDHLMSCLQTGKLTEFPKVVGSKGIPKGRKRHPLDSIKVDPICTCRRPEYFLNSPNPKWENLMRCDTCLDEFHYKCIGLDELDEKEAEKKKGNWSCEQCNSPYVFSPNNASRESD